MEPDLTLVASKYVPESTDAALTQFSLYLLFVTFGTSVSLFAYTFFVQMFTPYSIFIRDYGERPVS